MHPSGAAAVFIPGNREKTGGVARVMPSWIAKRFLVSIAYENPITQGKSKITGE
jgi:hypothetical protein